MARILRLAAASLLTTALAVSAQGARAFGELDTTFNSAAIPDTWCGGVSEPMIVLADGSSLVAVTIRDPRGIESPTGVARYRPDGLLDARWGSGGVGVIPGHGLSASALFALPGQGALIVGHSVVKLASSGAIDPAYGINGTTGFSEPLNPTESPTVLSAALQPDSSVVIAMGDYRGGDERIALTRFDRFGKRDLSFGQRGFLYLPIDTRKDVVYAWSVQSNGDAEVASYQLANGRVFASLRRYGPTGAPIAGFQPGGRLVPRQEAANWFSPMAKVDAAGRLLIASPIPSGRGVALSRFRADGMADIAFGVEGISIASSVASPRAAFVSERPAALLMGPGGAWTLLVHEEQTNGGWFGFVEAGVRAVRFTSSGALDTGFVQGAGIVAGQFVRLAQLYDGRLQTAADTGSGCALSRYRTGVQRTEATIAEYYHPMLDHYFMTIDSSEAGILDNNVQQMGWVRTGQVFGAWGAVDHPGAKQVCRFYGDLQAGPNSHFYTAEGSECDFLRQLEAQTPVGMRAWRLEELKFSVAEPENGRCPPNLAPVYRVYNDGFAKAIDPNHRYTASAGVYADMQSKGWIAEGVRFCAPPASSGLSRTW